jgi:hypothetical protein
MRIILLRYSKADRCALHICVFPEDGLADIDNSRPGQVHRPSVVASHSTPDDVRSMQYGLVEVDDNLILTTAGMARKTVWQTSKVQLDSRHIKQRSFLNWNTILTMSIPSH